MIWFLSGDVLQLVLKDYVSDVAVIFDEDKPLYLRWVFDSTTYDELYCKNDTEEIIFVNNN